MRAVSRGGPHLKISPYVSGVQIECGEVGGRSSVVPSGPSSCEPHSGRALPQAQLVSWSPIISREGLQAINDGGMELTGAYLAYLEKVHDVLKQSGWFSVESLSDAWATHFPMYTLGSDPNYREDRLSAFKKTFANTLPSIILDTESGGDVEFYVANGSEYIMRQPHTTAITQDQLMASLATEVRHNGDGLVRSEILSCLAMLGLYKNLDATPGPDDVKGEGGLMTWKKQLGNAIQEWVQNSRASGSAPVIPQLGLGEVCSAPQQVLDWLAETKPAIRDYLAKPIGGHNQPLLGSNFKATLNALLPRLSGLRIKTRTIQLPGEGKVVHVTSPVVYIRSARHRRFLKALNRLFPPVSLVDSRHQTVHLADLVWSLVESKLIGTDKLWPKSKHDMLKRINGVLQWIPMGTRQPYVIGMLLACLTHEHGAKIQDEYLRSGLFFTDNSQLQPRLKELGSIVRKCSWGPRTGKLTEGETRAMAYYDLLSGRSPNVTNWGEEINNRCKATLHLHSPKLQVQHGQVSGVGFVYPRVGFTWVDDSLNTDPNHMKLDEEFYSKLEAELLDVCRPLVTAKNTKERLGRFIRRRHEWIASGSSAGHKLQLGPLAKQVVGEDSIKISKRAWAEGITLADVIVALKAPPKEVAHASEKYENGKSRAIYGVEPMHYVINTYATKGFEEKLHLIPGLEKGLSGAQQANAEIRRAGLTRDRLTECTMLDYADFNRHHTPRAQAMIFDVFAVLGQRVGACADWIMANKWVAKAKYHMYSLFPGETKERKIYQGMFSGTRSTDLINTLLNLAYFRVASKALSMVGVHPKDLYNVHQGDDVWISNKSELWARGLYYTLNSMGFLFQESKQMFGKGRGEYLRVLYLDGTGGGYFARALANYITRPVQQNSSLDPLAWARTVKEGCALLSRRGLGRWGVQSLYNNGIQFWARVRAHPKDHKPLSIPQPLINGPGICGGLNCPPPLTSLPSVSDLADITLPSLPKFRTRVQVHKLGLPSHMTDEWLAHASELSDAHHTGYTFDAEAIRRQILNSNYQPDIQGHIRDKGWADFKKAWGTLLRDFKPSRFEAYANKALKPNYSLEDALLANTPVSGSELGRLSHMSIPPWEQHLSVIEQAKGTEVIDMTRTSSLLHAIINKSQFKSETTFAQAFNLSRLHAISLILAIAADRGYGNAEIDALTQPIILAENDELMEWMLGEKGDLGPAVNDWANVANWQYAQSQFLNATLQWLPSHPHANPRDVVKNLAQGWRSWLITCVRTPLVLSTVVY